MANAKKCDICGDFYSTYNTKDHPTKVSGFLYVNCGNMGCNYYQKKKDCCPVCMRAIQTFITNLEVVDVPTATELGLRELLDTQQVANARASLLAIDCNDDMTKAKMREYVEEAISYLDAALVGTTLEPET